MLFTSLEFMVLFLPLVLGGAFLLRGAPLLFWVAAASCVFYAFAGHAWFLIPMAVTTLIDFAVGHQLSVRKRRGMRLALLWFSLIANLGLLAYFKYSGLLLKTVAGLASVFGGDENGILGMTLNVILPAGISFYTFQTMSYVIDIYRGHAAPERSFVKYLTFVSFFPHLVAGPLTRHNQLLPQLTKIAADGIRPLWRSGALLFFLGLLKKVCIADRVGNMIDPAIADLGNSGLIEAWLLIIGYSMQLYFDFSGYSDMAVGLGRLFNVELPQNFNSPYKALDPSDFWRRWHISLSQWLRDYLYISLGGNRSGEFRRKFNLMVTMFLGGLWHGASWNFAIWGSYHGLLLIFYHRFGGLWDRIPVPIRRTLTFALICIGWVFFRAHNLPQSMEWLKIMAGANGLLGSAFSPKDLFLLAAMVCSATAFAMTARNTFELKIEEFRPARLWALGTVAGVAILLMTFSSKFLYYQF